MSRARMLYEDMTVFQMLQKNAGKFQERTMLSYWRDGQAVSVTHSGFLRDVQRLAAYFDRLGLRGRRIVIDGRNTYEQLAALFAAMSMGAAAVLTTCGSCSSGCTRRWSSATKRTATSFPSFPGTAPPSHAWGKTASAPYSTGTARCIRTTRA